jgi:hypothetical protein
VYSTDNDNGDNIGSAKYDKKNKGVKFDALDELTSDKNRRQQKQIENDEVYSTDNEDYSMPTRRRSRRKTG